MGPHRLHSAAGACNSHTTGTCGALTFPSMLSSNVLRIRDRCTHSDSVQCVDSSSGCKTTPMPSIAFVSVNTRTATSNAAAVTSIRARGGLGEHCFTERSIARCNIPAMHGKGGRALIHAAPLTGKPVVRSHDMPGPLLARMGSWVFAITQLHSRLWCKSAIAPISLSSGLFCK